MKNLVIVIVIAVVAAACLSTTMSYFLLRNSHSSVVERVPTCVDSTELTNGGKVTCEFAEQRIEVWPVSKESWYKEARILVKCTCPREGK